MKLAARDADAYFAKPDKTRTGLLIYGGDSMRVALKRQQVIAALLGPNAEEEMRLARLSGAELRRDPAQLLDAVKAVGFFPGPRVAFVEEAGEGTVPALQSALADWREGDAQIIVTAGALRANSKLRKLFEGHRNAYAVGLYDDPPSRAEVERLLGAAGLRDASGESMDALTELALTLGPGDFAQTVEKLALYKLDDSTPVTPEDVAICAPRSTEAALDALLNAAAEGQSDRIGPLIARMESQGATAVSLCIGAMRHFRQLYTVMADPDGAASALNRMRPPIFGARRDHLMKQTKLWSPERLESALGELTNTDLHLRSAGQTAPAMALVSRTLIRLAAMARRR
ncbi:DNA polymerase III subunit delta [Pontibaca salina]|uniref:DNA-directed DNA polymerase n=1 Tax=Pontibaca salina TaxID=2795731 RepID=A0A934M3A1_9RHOB|nr:DNA polymerase III subunit delta [Pontibaca salina]MBI6629654.1 DNA polymerase III subunit delta [Pontibaca salina]